MKSIFTFNKKTNFILSFIGSIIFQLCGGCTFVISQFNVYVTSYIHYKDNYVDMQYGHIILPLMAFSLAVFVPLGGILENKVGLNLSLIISAGLLEFVIFLFINQRNIWFTYFLIILMGLSNGLGIQIPKKNACFYYPEKKALILSTISSISILITGIFCVIGEKIINPDKVVLGKDEQYYPLEISKNYIIFYKYVLIIIPLCTVASLLLIYKYDISMEDNEIIEEYKLKEYKDNNDINSNGSLIKKENYSENIKAILYNFRIWRIAIIASLSSFSLGFSINTFRVYGALISINGTVMQYSGGIGAILLFICTPIWGYINDHFPFSFIIKIVCASTIIHSLLLTLFLNFSYIYIFCVTFGCIITSGLLTTINPHVMHVYGIEYTLEVTGTIGVCHGSIHGIGAIIAFILSKYFHTGKELQSPYKKLFFIGMIACIGALYLSSKENDEKFIYPNNIILEKSMDNIKKDSNFNDYREKCLEKGELNKKQNVELIEM